jgi:predicted amidophosphoribosyltransferase
VPNRPERSRNGNFATVFVLWCLFGPLGFLLLALSRDRSLDWMRECPSCKELMRRDAGVCPHCRRESQAWVLHDGHWWAKNQAGKYFYLDKRANVWRESETWA